MPQLPVLDKRPADDGGVSNNIPEPKTPFKLSQLDLGSIGVTKRPGGRKRAAASAALDDDEDPLEEAQVENSTILKSHATYSSSRTDCATLQLAGLCTPRSSSSMSISNMGVLSRLLA